MPDRFVFELGYNKNNLMRICKEFGYPHPMTLDMRDYEKYLVEELNLGMIPELESFPYPGLLKPNLTSGGRGMTLVNSLEALKTVYPVIHEQYGECHLQQFIKEGGRQIKVQIMTDENSETVYSSVIWKQRYYPVNGGSSSGA